MMLFGILVFLYVLVCLLLCVVILIQSDKGGGISGAFGGGLASASALLGTQDTANILTRGTTLFATLYMALCVVISLFVARTAVAGGGESVLKRRAEQQETPSSILQGGGLKLEEDTPAGTEQESAPLPFSPQGDNDETTE
jgi:preprotein translocase subunit SecG